MLFYFLFVYFLLIFFFFLLCVLAGVYDKLYKYGSSVEKRIEYVFIDCDKLAELWTTHEHKEHELNILLACLSSIPTA